MIIDKNRYCYTVKSTTVIVNGAREELYVIVLCDITTKLWVMMTDYADLTFYKSDRDGFRFNTDKGALHDVCKFLNAVMFEKNDKYNISSPLEITVDIAQHYLDNYVLTPTKRGKLPEKKTVEHVKKSISVFLNMMAYCREEKMQYIKYGDLISMHYEIGADHKPIIVFDYKLKVRSIPSISGYVSLERDMPLGIVNRFIQMARIYDPEMEFPITLLAYAGLREGEVCNFRRKSSRYGSGYKDTVITITTPFGIKRECRGFEINLSKEYVMRSDGKDVGGIKCKRTQPIFGPFAQIIYDALERHLSLVANKKIEDYGPMFVNKRADHGTYLAMTKKGLRERLDKLFYDHVLPSCKDDPDIDMQVFYRRMQGRTWGGHAFRHWFSVILVLCDCDQAKIMSFRGDRNPRSAMIYLERKGVFQQKYSKAIEKNILKYIGA